MYYKQKAVGWQIDDKKKKTNSINRIQRNMYYYIRTFEKQLTAALVTILVFLL